MTISPSPYSSETRTWALIAHLVGLFGFPFIGPIIIWLTKGKEDEFVLSQAKEVLNFHITLLIVVAILGALSVATCGVFLVVAIPLWATIAVVAVVLSIYGGIQAYEGKRYRYPLCIRLIS